MLYEQDSSVRMKRAVVAGATIEAACDGPAWMDLANNFVLKLSGYDTTALYDNCKIQFHRILC